MSVFSFFGFNFSCGCCSSNNANGKPMVSLPEPKEPKVVIEGEVARSASDNDYTGTGSTPSLAEEFGHETESVPTEESDSEDSDTEVQEVSEEQTPGCFIALCALSPKAAESEDKEGPTIETRLPKVLENVPLTPSFRVETDILPEPKCPADASKNRTVNAKHLQDLSLEAVKDAIGSDEFFMRYLTESGKARDVTLTPWGTAASGVRVRRAKYIMPVPQDVPPALARLVSVPQESKATMIIGFWSVSEDELIMIVHQCTHEVPCGDNFRVHETLSFRREGDGVIYSKWSMAKWVKSLPFMMSAMKPITESKLNASAIEGAPLFERILREAAQGL